MTRSLTTCIALAGALLWSAPLFACEECGCEVAATPHSHQTNNAQPAEHAADHTHAVTSAEIEQDRKAILAMAGDYKVTFQFQETVGIKPGYELKEPYHSEATEFIEVIEDRGDFISLQHVLVLHDEETGEARVVKHWRQDWTYQDTQINAYRGNNTWEHVALDPHEVIGTWSQAVYQVDDSPRYESYGKWNHDGARSAWESKETWRPLPRREYTKRSDYGVMVARNRHTITPAGWVHEQDNNKLVIDEDGNPQQILVHESGLNVYDRVDDVDFAAGHEYWQATQAYWQDVRAIWKDVLAHPGSVTLAKVVDDQPMYKTMFAMAKEVKEAGNYDTQAMSPVVREKIEAYLVD